nr:glycosyltransferase [Bacteroidota bacterium]
MWYSKHHYAAYLAKKNTVYFINLPDRWRWRDLFSFGITVRKTSERVNVVTYRNNLPLNILPSWLRSMIADLNARKLRKLTREGPVVHWCFYPTSILNGRLLRRNGAKVIYHIVDPYQNLPNDTHFAINADMIVAINPWYLKYYGELNRKCILIPHGVRKEDRLHDHDLAVKIREQWGDYAVLATGLNRFVNYPLLQKVADRYPDLTFLIAGQLFSMKPSLEEMRDDLFARRNIKYVGLKHPDELKDLVHGARLGLLAYDFEVTRSVPVSAGRTPLKVLTYLSQLCPVISTNNSYVPPLDHKGYFKAEDEQHFVELVGKVLNGDIGVDVEVVDE